MSMLTLSEQLMLLGLNDEKGTVIFTVKTQFPYAISGAILFDLYYKGIISIRDESIIVTKKEQPACKFIEYAADILIQSGKNHEINTAAAKLADHYDEISSLILDSLVTKGILKKEMHKLLWILKQEVYPTADPAPERMLRDTIRAVILDDKLPNNKELVLISLIGACDLVNEIFTYEEREIAEDKISVLSDEEFLEQLISINESIMVKTVSLSIKSTIKTTIA